MKKDMTIEIKKQKNTEKNSFVNPLSEAGDKVFFLMVVMDKINT